MIGSHTDLQRIRASIAHARNTIARLAAAGVEPRMYITHNCDDEFFMDTAVCNVRVMKQRYRDAIAQFRMRQGPRLPAEVVGQTFRRAA